MVWWQRGVFVKSLANRNDRIKTKANNRLFRNTFVNHLLAAIKEGE